MKHAALMIAAVETDEKREATAYSWLWAAKKLSALQAKSQAHCK
jgi:hypothetical protein